MTTYPPPKGIDINSYQKYKDHMLEYSGKIRDFKNYDRQIRTICQIHKTLIDDKFKSHMINMYISNDFDEIPEEILDNYMPTDEQLCQMPTTNQRFLTYNTWPHFTCAAVQYIYRSLVPFPLFHVVYHVWDSFVINNILKIQWTDQCIAFVFSTNIPFGTAQLIIAKSALTTTTLLGAYIAHNTHLIELHNMPMTHECVEAAAVSYKHNKKFVNELIAKLPMTSETLSILIKIDSYPLDKFTDILQHITPDQSHVKLACTHQRFGVLKILLNHRLTVDNECFELLLLNYNINILKTNVAEMIEMFINAGYELTYEDVIRLARRGLFVNDIERFNFKIDEELIEVCLLHNINVYDLPYTIESLRLACQCSSDSVIEKILNTGIKPDRKCIINIFASRTEGCIEDILPIMVPHLSDELLKDPEILYLLKQWKMAPKTTIKY